MQDPDFAGKTVLYSLTFVALKSRALPALDDELRHPDGVRAMCRLTTCRHPRANRSWCA